MLTYDTIKQILLNAVNDPDFRRKNTLLQDPKLALEMQTRVNAITPDVNIVLDSSKVINHIGALKPNPAQRTIDFDPDAGYVLSNFKDGSVSAPGKIFARVAPGAFTPSDNVRYLVADAAKGVLLLNEDLQTIRVWPGLNTAPTTAPTYQYTNAVAVITFFDQNNVEYIAIAMGAPWHIVNVYNYTTGAGVVSLGVLSTESAPPTGLGTPNALAYNNQTNTLYISCATGQPAGAISNTGCIASYAWPAGPLAVVANLYTSTNGSLISNQVSGPKALLNDGSCIWVVNGNDEIAQVQPSNGWVQRYFAPSSYTYKFSGVTDIKLKSWATPNNKPTSGSVSSDVDIFPIITFMPNDSFVGKVDGASSVTGLIQATRATLTSVSATYAAVPAGAHLDVYVAGFANPQVLVFDGTELGQTAWLVKLNTLMLGVNIVNWGGQIQIQTDQFGSGAAGVILSTSSLIVLASLGLTARAFVNAGPNNVVDSRSVTKAEFATFLTNSFPGSHGVAGEHGISWVSNTSGPNSSVQWVSGTGLAKVSGFDLALHTGSDQGATPSGQIYLYVANGAYGNVLVLNLSDNKVVRTFGSRATTDNALSQANLFFANSGSVTGLLPDLVDYQCAQKNIIVIADAVNKRIQKIDEDSYDQLNQCVFRAFSFTVPVVLRGWALSGSLPADMVTVSYRTCFEEPWHTLETIAQTKPLQNLHVRISAQVSPDKAVGPCSIQNLIILAEQS